MGCVCVVCVFPFIYLLYKMGPANQSQLWGDGIDFWNYYPSNKIGPTGCLDREVCVIWTKQNVDPSLPMPDT